jgi:hypothetical protein
LSSPDITSHLLGNHRLRDIGKLCRHRANRRRGPFDVEELVSAHPHCPEAELSDSSLNDYRSSVRPGSPDTVSGRDEDQGRTVGTLPIQETSEQKATDVSVIIATYNGQ